MEFLSKQVYAAPRLTVFGNVERITQTWNVGGDLSGCHDVPCPPPKSCNPKPNCPPPPDLS